MGWKAGILVMLWEEFGEICGSVVLGILEEVMLGAMWDLQEPFLNLIEKRVVQ